MKSLYVLVRGIVAGNYQQFNVSLVARLKQVFAVRARPIPVNYVTVAVQLAEQVNDVVFPSADCRRLATAFHTS